MNQVHYKKSFNAAARFTLCFLLFPVFLAAQDSQFNYATGKVSGRNFVGGLAGRISEGVAVTNSFARGEVSGVSHVGGFAGSNLGIVENSYATGRVTGNSGTGGLAASGSGAVTNSYWDLQTSAQATSAGGTGRNSDPMTYPYASDTYAGWNFTSVWKADMLPSQNGGYPLLAASEVYKIDIQVYPPGSGSVTGNGYYPAGQQIQLQATPQQQYVFKGWLKNSEMTSNQPQYALKVTENTSLTARFESKITSIDSDLNRKTTELTIYPNPVNEVLWADHPSFVQGKVEIAIINITGQMVFRRSVESVHSAVPVNIEGLPGGMYLIHAGNSKGHYSGKFIKK